MVDFERNRLVDLDPEQPGFNMLPLGKFPEVISASQDGCRAVTANRASCDLSFVDTTRLVARSFGNKQPSPGGWQRTRPGGGAEHRSRHRHRPAFARGPAGNCVPAATPDGGETISAENRCSNAGAYEGAGLPVHPWRALVTFPGCDLVALIDLPSGEIVSSVYVRPEGTVDAGRTRSARLNAAEPG